MTRRKRTNDPIANYIEWSQHRYDPGHYLGGNLPPHLRKGSLGAAARGNPFGNHGGHYSCFPRLDFPLQLTLGDARLSPKRSLSRVVELVRGSSLVTPAITEVRLKPDSTDVADLNIGTTQGMVRLKPDTTYW